jgi:isopentenyldiphosphate isomerase
MTTIAAPPDVAQDPAELFDVVRADGTPTGEAKARAAVHRDGDWHRAVHVWVAGIDAASGSRPFLLMQRRGSEKDTWPGRFDATVGGHLRAGEEVADALRESEEEIGIAVDLADLRFLGNRIAVNESEPGIRDRELQSVYLLRDDRPLTAYRPSPYELAALVKLPLLPLLAFLSGETADLLAESIAPGATAIEPFTATRDDFIPTFDRYLYRVAIAVSLALRGESHVSV